MKKFIAFLSVLSVSGLRCQQPAEQSVKPAVKIGAFTAAASHAAGAAKQRTPERPGLPPLTENPGSPDRPLSSLAKRNGSPSHKPEVPAASPFTPLDLAQPVNVHTLGVPVSSAPASPQSKSTAAQAMELPVGQRPVGASAAAAAGAAGRYQVSVQPPYGHTIALVNEDEESGSEGASNQAPVAAEYVPMQQQALGQPAPASPMSLRPASAFVEGNLHGSITHDVKGSRVPARVSHANPLEMQFHRGDVGQQDEAGAVVIASPHTRESVGSGYSKYGRSSANSQNNNNNGNSGHNGDVHLKPALAEGSKTRIIRKEKEKEDEEDRIAERIALNEKIATCKDDLRKNFESLKARVIKYISSPNKDIQDYAQRRNISNEESVKILIFNKRYGEILKVWGNHQYCADLDKELNEATTNKEMLWNEIVLEVKRQQEEVKKQQEEAKKQQESCCVIL